MTSIGPEQSGQRSWLLLGAGSVGCATLSNSSAVSEEAEATDADQALRQDMKEKAAQELVAGDGHHLLLASVSVVLAAEGDATVLEREEAMVGDGDPVRVVG